MFPPYTLPYGTSVAVATLVLLLIPLPDEPRAAAESPSGSAAAEIAGRWRDEIRPILADHCVGCHGAAKQEGNLSLQSLQALMAGGERGPLLDHQSPGASLLVRVLQPESDPHMPPDEQLGEDILVRLSDWARQAATIAPDRWESLAEEAETALPPAAEDDLPWPAGVDPALVIDIAIQSRWQGEETGPQPTPSSNDNTFVRRLYLDLVGRIPTLEEHECFVRDVDSRKREALIDRLLETPEHARHMAELFDTMLMGRGDARRMKRRQKNGWLEFLTTAFAENRPWDSIARQILLARPTTPAEKGAPWYLVERDDEPQVIAEAISRGIFGVQIQCAQCHDHPLAAEIKQGHYWGLVAFFNRGKNIETPEGPRVAESAVGGFSMFTNLSGESQPNRLVFLKAEVVDEPRPAEGETQEDRAELYLPTVGDAPKVPRFSRRQQFVDQILADHPLVARAMVNRLWALMMGRGLVHPVDQLDSVHPPSHPRLLDWLAQDFQRSGYDVRRLLRQIARSATYQLSSESESFADPSLFRVAAVKPLSAEALYRSMLIALEINVPEQWDSEGAVMEFRHAFPDVLADDSVATPRQALLMANGEQVHQIVSADHSPTIARLIAMSESSEVVQHAFLCVLGRDASEEEFQQSIEYLNARSDRSDQAISQFVWTLLSSAEFRFNH